MCRCAYITTILQPANMGNLLRRLVSLLHPATSTSRRLNPEMLAETFHFLDRDEIDSCELVARAWLTTIQQHASTLALRRIEVVSMDYFRQRVSIDTISE